MPLILTVSHQSLPRENLVLLILVIIGLFPSVFSSPSPLEWIAIPNKVWASYIQNFASIWKISHFHTCSAVFSLERRMSCGEIVRTPETAEENWTGNLEFNVQLRFAKSPFTSQESHPELSVCLASLYKNKWDEFTSWLCFKKSEQVAADCISLCLGSWALEEPRVYLSPLHIFKDTKISMFE